MTQGASKLMRDELEGQEESGDQAARRKVPTLRQTGNNWLTRAHFQQRT